MLFRCGNCGDSPDHWQYITLTESHPLKGGRGEASCVVKCKLCSRENSIDILKVKNEEHHLEIFSNGPQTIHRQFLIRSLLI